MGLVAQIASRRGWPTGSSWSVSPPSGGNYPITYPATPLGLKAELLLGGVWTDITTHIYKETKIKIVRGRTNEANRAQPSKCSIRLKNSVRTWSPRNPNGPFYGKLNRNVKLRISVNPGDGEHIRYTGFVSQWPNEWTTGNHRWVDVQANGILKRLGQGKSALRTPIYRAVSAQNPYAFWTLTDTSDSTVGLSEIVGGSPVVPTGDIAFAGATDTPDGAPALVVNSGYTLAPVTPAQPENSDGFIFGFGMKMVAPPLSFDLGLPMLKFTTTGWYTQWDVVPASEDGSFPMQIEFRDTFETAPAGVNLSQFYTSEQEVNTLYDNVWHYYQIVVQRVNTFMTVSAYQDGVFAGGVTLPTSGLVAVGNVTGFEINPELADWAPYNLSITNVSVLPLNVVNNDYRAFAAYIGERPTDRFARLCTEEGIDYTIAELIADTETMGTQATDTLMNLLRECEATNEGVMDEDIIGRLRLISRSFTWNQPPAMIIDYTSGAIQYGFKPTDDDLLVSNDWSITRKGGNTRRYEKTTGALNVNDPTVDPNGINRYDTSATLNLQTDDQAYQHAALRVARGTVDEMRIAEMPLHFASIAGGPLLPSWLNMDINVGFRINNTPLDMGGQPSWQVMTGYTEDIDRLEWKATLYGAPASLEQVGILDTYGYLDCSACILAEDLDTAETAIDVAIADVCVWVATSLPFNVIFSGEEVTVTAVGAPTGGGSAWTQTLTVVRSVNGVVKTHSAGAEVHVAQPFILVL